MKDKELWLELIAAAGWKVIENTEPNYEYGWRKVLFAGTGWYIIFDRHLNFRFLESIKQIELVISDREKFEMFFKLLKCPFTVSEGDGVKMIRLDNYKFVIVLSKIDEYLRTEKYE